MLSRLKAMIGNRNPVRLAWHRGKAFAAAARYGFPARKLTVIGITGTDGKTTTVGMTAHILQACGHPTGALSTAYFSIKNEITWNATQKTSPSPFAIQAFLKRLVTEGCTHAVLEYSSHGLVQGRTNYTWPTVAAITNTTPEHLDYHGTMEQYRADKGLLFALLGGKGTKVLNRADETHALYSAIPSSATVSYGMTPPAQREDTVTTLWTTDVRSQPKATTCRVVRTTPGGTEESVSLSLPVPGAFNVENALCAIGCAVACGVSFAKAVSTLDTFAGIPGRMERIDEGQTFSVFVDFTVTPASYEKTLHTLGSMRKNGSRLLVLMGSCGDRMKEKRPEIGRIAASRADVVVVTNEDPYTEDPETIIDAVIAGTKGGTAAVQRIVDRGEAIRWILGQARADDIVILCGKGSDTTMWVKDGKIPWNERDIVREELRAMQRLR